MQTVLEYIATPLAKSCDKTSPPTTVALKPWPARPSGVAREAILIGKKT